MILSPSGSETLIGCSAGCLLMTGALMTKKWLVAPESNTAHSCIFSLLMLTVNTRALAACTKRVDDGLVLLKGYTPNGLIWYIQSCGVVVVVEGVWLVGLMSGGPLFLCACSIFHL